MTNQHLCLLCSVYILSQLVPSSIWPEGLQHAYYYHQCDTTDYCKPALKLGEFILFQITVTVNFTAQSDLVEPKIKGLTGLSTKHYFKKMLLHIYTPVGSISISISYDIKLNTFLFLIRLITC